jgi:hypothetical protein
VLKVEAIAEEAGCGLQNVREALKALVKHGVVERFEDEKHEVFLYRIVGRNASRYRGAQPTAAAKGKDFRGAGAAPAAENDTLRGALPAPIIVPRAPRGAANDTPSLRESKIYEIEDYSPAERETSFPTGPNVLVGDLSQNADASLIALGEVSPAMRESAGYFLRESSQKDCLLSALWGKPTSPTTSTKKSLPLSGILEKNAALCLLTLFDIYNFLQYRNLLKNIQDQPPPQADTLEEKTPDPYEWTYL